jgi:ATP-dependent protease ClpP protease subunit
MQCFPADSYLFEIELHWTRMLLKSVADSMHIILTVNGSMRAALPEAKLMIHGTGM